jgi:hypothetical protein
MMRILCWVLLPCTFAVAVNADELGEIRDYYDAVMARLDDEYGIYRTELSVNTEDTMYPAVGHYQEHVTFYWGSEGGMLWPILVVWTEEHASASIHGEVLYRNPSLEMEYGQDQAIYQYILHSDWNGVETEYSWYWWDGLLLNSSGSSTTPEGDVTDFVPESPESYGLYKTSRELLRLFRYIHGEPYAMRE